MSDIYPSSLGARAFIGADLARTIIASSISDGTGSTPDMFVGTVSVTGATIRILSGDATYACQRIIGAYPTVTVGDTVLVVRIGTTAIILGKVTA